MRKNIIDKLFFGGIGGIAEIGERINKYKKVKILRKELKETEKKFFSSKDEETSKEAQKIIGYYKKLLLINLKEGYREGIKTGFELSEELIKTKK